MCTKGCVHTTQCKRRVGVHKQSFFVWTSLTHFFFPTGLVRLYIAGLPRRSCQTIGAPSVQGSAQCPFFRFWLQQDSNPHPGAYHADVLPLHHFDPLIAHHPFYSIALLCMDTLLLSILPTILMYGHILHLYMFTPLTLYGHP